MKIRIEIDGEEADLAKLKHDLWTFVWRLTEAIKSTVIIVFLIALVMVTTGSIVHVLSLL